MALVPLNDRFKIIENSTLRVSFSIILNDHLIGLVAMVYPVIRTSTETAYQCLSSPYCFGAFEKIIIRIIIILFSVKCFGAGSIHQMPLTLKALTIIPMPFTLR